MRSCEGTEDGGQRNRDGIGCRRDASPEQYEYVEEVVEYRDTRLMRILMAVVLVLLALLLAYLGYQVYRAQKGEGGAANQAGSKEMVWIQSIYGWGDADGQQLIRPNTVAVDADGLIWTNSNNRAAVAFNPDGTFDRILESQPSRPGSGAVEPQKPPAAEAAPTVTTVFSLATDDANDLYLLDNAEAAIHQITAEAGIQTVLERTRGEQDRGKRHPRGRSDRGQPGRVRSGYGQAALRVRYARFRRASVR